MKKIIFSAIICFAFIFNAQAQDKEEVIYNENYSDWQVKVRGLYVSPAPYFYRNVDAIEVDISTTFAPELGFAYFFSRKMSAELMVNTSTHDVEVEGGSNLGSITLISPTLSLLHHLYIDEKWKPYIGAGLNYTAYTNEDAGDLTSIEYKNELGYVIQAGLDYRINDKWFINLDFRKIYLKTEVTGDNNTDQTAEVNVDPIIFGFGIGRNF